MKKLFLSLSVLALTSLHASAPANKPAEKEDSPLDEITWKRVALATGLGSVGVGIFDMARTNEDRAKAITEVTNHIKAHQPNMNGLDQFVHASVVVGNDGVSQVHNLYPDITNEATKALIKKANTRVKLLGFQVSTALFWTCVLTLGYGAVKKFVFPADEKA